MKHSISASFTTIVMMFVLTGLASANPVIRSASGANAAAIQAAVDQFRADLGMLNPNTNQTFASGRREINWDGVPDNFASPNNLPVDFFNSNSPRGVVLSPAVLADLRVSANSSNPTNTPIRFGEINPSYPSTFAEVFSAQRLFAIVQPNSGGTGDSPVLDVFFYIPGTSIPATVRGFGVVFSDVDSANDTGMICYGQDGRPLGSPIFAPNWPGGLSFVGVFFDAGERIARVKIGTGKRILTPGNTETNPDVDVVAMDDFIYGEPRAIGYHTGDFDGDSFTDINIFRPSTAQWLILNSGTGTVTFASFGSNGDVPIDGDFDGDSKADLAIYRPSLGQWWLQRSSDSSVLAVTFGENTDVPAAGDYDEDGKTDIALFRPSSGTWFVLRSSAGFASYYAFPFGQNGDIPVQGAAH